MELHTAVREDRRSFRLPRSIDMPSNPLPASRREERRRGGVGRHRGAECLLLAGWTRTRSGRLCISRMLGSRAHSLVTGRKRDPSPPTAQSSASRSEKQSVAATGVKVAGPQRTVSCRGVRARIPLMLKVHPPALRHARRNRPSCCQPQLCGRMGHCGVPFQPVLSLYQWKGGGKLACNTNS